MINTLDRIIRAVRFD